MCWFIGRAHLLLHICMYIHVYVYVYHPGICCFFMVVPFGGGAWKDPKNKTAWAPSRQPRPPSPGVIRVLAPTILVFLPTVAYSPINHVSKSQLSSYTNSDVHSLGRPQLHFHLLLEQIYPSACWKSRWKK